MAVFCKTRFAIANLKYILNKLIFDKQQDLSPNLITEAWAFRWREAMSVASLHQQEEW